jgi:DNA-binding IclR family transcriptional regulator
MQADMLPAPGREQAASNRTVDRVIRVLKAVTCGAANITEISRQTQIPYATSHRLVMALIEGGMLSRNASRRITARGRLIDTPQVALTRAKEAAHVR